ncbi:peptidoglycan editing factor PgeF [Pelagibacteraceae bacterium]|nr:peptidoglycan editing factor PgeF [Pelagibacteraceae bacterium]
MFYSKKLNKFKDINHCFFSKKGGYSNGIYKSLNCGKGSRDNKKNILQNLVLVAKKLKTKKNKLLLMHQTHSSKVIIINNKNRKNKIFKSDAIITNVKGISLGVVTADCVPIFLYDIRNKIIGCIHAGWRGASSGIIENTISKFKEINSNNEIYSSIGPCIGKKSYEVNFDFYKNFISLSKKNNIYFVSKNEEKKLFDLRKYVADKLLKLKVKVDHVNHDTFKEKDNFFSYRRSQKLSENDYGRCISVISLI